MKAVQFSEYGKPDVLQMVEVPVPELKEGYVLVQVKAAGVNFADTMKRNNQYLTHTPVPYILGSEVAGVIAEVTPEVTSFQQGDRVVAITDGGCYAEYVPVHESQLIRIPEGVDFQQAAALLLQGLTAYHILKTSGHLIPGESVLVHAAAGGVGTLAVQLAKLFGAGQVIATASTPDKLELALSLGADEAVSYLRDNWKEQVMDLTGGKGVDVVLEMVGGQVFHKSLECLAKFGRLVIYGIASQEKPVFDGSVLMHRNNSVSGFWLPRILQRPDLYKQSLQELLQYLCEGKLKLTIGEVLPFSEASHAHEKLEGRQTKGKVILVP